MDIGKYTMVELIEKVKMRELKVFHIISWYLNNIKEKNKRINAFTYINEDCINEAHELDRKIENGEEVGPLWGMPIAVKDNIAVKGMRNTCGSRMLEDYISPYDAQVIELIKNNNGIIIGKTNMDEFGMGCSSDTSYYGRVRNPIDEKFSCGGSSGGSAAAVIGNMAVIALGSDTGGSVRQPAAFTGLWGMKPSYGRLSRYGLTTFASTLDTVGIIGKSREDVEMFLDIVEKENHKDSTATQIDEEIEGDEAFKIGIIEEYLKDDIYSCRDIKESYEKIRDGELNTKKVSLKNIDEFLWCYYIISSAEASTTLSRFDGITFGRRAEGEFDGFKSLVKKSRGEGFGNEVKKRIITGNYIISQGHKDDYYRKACTLRDNLKKSMDEILQEVDVIVVPTTGDRAYCYEEIDSKGKMFQYKGDIFTVPFSLCGLPAVSVPVGIYEGMPYGMQVIGKRGEDKKLLRYAESIMKNMRGEC